MLFAMKRKTSPIYATKGDIRRLDNDIRELYKSFADEIEGLKGYICEQQKQINKLQRLADELRARR